LTFMSVWNQPCYSIEPLRSAANNLPFTDDDIFPEELAGIANFSFGNCSNRHPDKAEANAAEYFAAKPDEWAKFARAGRKNLRGADAVCFRNTLEQTNTKYAGIRAVYWAFSKFRTETWETKQKLDTKEAVNFVNKVFTLAASPSRINQVGWEQHLDWYEKDSSEGHSKVYSWCKAEEIADSVRYLWTLKTSQKQRIITKKREALVKRTIGSKFKRILTKDGVDQITKNEIRAMRALGASGFNVEEARKAYSVVMKKVKAREEISIADAKNVSVLPYVEYPQKGARLIVFTYRGGLILYDKVDKESALILEKDHDRLVQMLQGDAKLVKYYTKYAFHEKELSSLMIDKYEAIMKLTLKSMANLTDYNCNRICRAFDVCQFLMLARLASDLNDDAVNYQTEKIKKEKLDEIIDVDAYMRIIDDEELGVKETLELAKFNKIFPCPDFCVHSVVDSIEDYAENPHPVSDRAVLGVAKGAEVVADVDEFENYCLRNRLINFFDVHDFLPGKIRNTDDPEFPSFLTAYPNVPITKIKVEHMKYIDIADTFMYRTYDGCEHELVKDKVIAPTKDKDSNKELSEFKPTERNQVMKFLFSRSFMSQKALSELAISGDLFEKYQQWILLALKAEAKKPGSRAFSMATDEVRRLLSEAEKNIATYVTHQRGSSQGKSDKDLSERLALLSGTPQFMIGHTATMFAFDLDKFSPRQNPEFKRRAMKSWSLVFGSPVFDSTIKVFTETTLEFQKFGVKDKFDMVGNDLEGFHGRLNTAAHADLMGYAVYKLKQLELTRGAASLEVLIDDGALRIDIANDQAGENVQIVTDVIDRVYAFAGQKISWDKTFVSRVMMQYLNRVFYDGIEVTPGAKAFMRIGKKQEVAVPTIISEFEAHASAARGAIQSGSDHFLTYYEYIFEVYKTLKKWGMPKGSDADLDRLAFAMFIPIGLGGFGISSLYGLSTNEGFNSMQAGIAAMRMICHSFPAFAPMANKYLNAGIRTMTTEGILRNPTAWRTKLRCLNLRRFENAAKAKVLGSSTNTLVQAANRGDFDEADDAILAAIEADKNISEVKRKMLWNITSKSHIDSLVGKLQSSSTAAAMLGRKKCLVIFIANRSEARLLIKETMMGRLVQRVL